MNGFIPRPSLMHPRESAFNHVYLSGRQDAPIAMCGFCFASFHVLLSLFAPMFDAYTPYPQSSTNRGTMRRLPVRRVRRGRPRLIDATKCLGLVLAWTRTCGHPRNLQLIFGLTGNPLSVWLRFGRRIIVKVLRNHPDARVCMPTSAQIMAYKMAISAKYPDLVDVWSFLDGLKLPVEVCTVRREIQAMFYNGWQHDHFASNLFLFVPDGRIVAAYLNAPGTWHDSILATRSGLYNRAQRHTQEGTGVWQRRS